MQELKVELPIKINGVIISPDLFNELDYIQLGGTGSCSENSTISNSGYEELTDCVNKAIYFVLSSLSEKSDLRSATDEFNVLKDLYILHGTISRLKAPDKFLTKAG